MACSGDCGTCYVRAENQPSEIDMVVDGIFAKQIVIPEGVTLIPQHAHTYDHITLLAHGSVRLFAEGHDLGTFAAPKMIKIPANVKHSFEPLVAGTVLCCIHNVSRDGEVHISEEHHLPGLG